MLPSREELQGPLHFDELKELDDRPLNGGRGLGLGLGLGIVHERALGLDVGVGVGVGVGIDVGADIDVGEEINFVLHKRTVGDQ